MNQEARAALEAIRNDTQAALAQAQARRNALGVDIAAVDAQIAVHQQRLDALDDALAGEETT